MITLELPVPPPVNKRLIGSIRRATSGKKYAGFRRTKAANQYQDAIRVICAKEKVKPLHGDVVVFVTWHRARRAGDVVDRWKDLCDSLEAEKNHGFGPYVNDDQIQMFTARRIDDDPKHSRIVVKVWAADEYASYLGDR